MSNCKVIALTNQKGGVGKTTTAVNLGVSLVQQGKKVLLIDADAQANLTMALGYNRPDDIPITLSTVMQNIIDDKTLDASQGIIHHREGVDLLPSNIELSGFEVRLINAMSRERVLKTYVNEVKKNYDYVLIDCMPSLGMITINALAAADSVIIPTQPHYLSAKGLELFHTNDGINGVAKYLNDHGYKKKIRQNGTIPGFSSNFVKDVLDNPVYMGKIAYGRRRTEKKLGTRNEMHVVEQDEFPIYEGQHEAIISEEDWNLAQDKRKANAFRREKVIDPEHAHILSGILKCPCCGKSLYGNIAKAHSKDKKTRYYYYCKNTLGATGHKCTFRVNIEQMEMNHMVAAIISAMVNDPKFSKAIKEKIGTSVDTEDLEKQLSTLQAQLRQTLGIKSRLERQMDTLDINDPYFDRKILDLQRRYDEQYGRIEEIETQIDEVKSQIQSIRQEKISGDNIYQLLLAFDEVYNAATEIEQKEFMRAFIERIDLYPEKQKDGNWIRNMVFNFPVPVNGQEVKELPLESGTILETVVLLSKPNAKQHIEAEWNLDELDLTAICIMEIWEIDDVQSEREDV